MHYDFDEIIDRTHQNAAKYDERVQNYGTDQVLPLWIADMDFRTAQPIVEAVTARAQEGVFGYSARPESYFQAIRDWQLRRHGWDIDPQTMSFSLGVVESISACIQLFTPAGGTVLIQPPVYAQFYEMPRVCGRKILENRLIERDGAWSVDWADFEEKVQQADLFLLCNPQNPLGLVWSREDLERMAELCLRHHVLIFSDEIHSDLIFHGKKHTPMASLSPETARQVITGISGTKTFNLAGMQASTAVLPDAEKKEAFDRFWLHMNIRRNNPFSLVAMEAAYREGEEWLEQLLPYLSDNFDFVTEFCRTRIPRIRTHAPDATYLMWLDCRELGLEPWPLFHFMVEKAGLGLSDGRVFDPELGGFMRLNAACPRSVLKQAMEQLERAVNSLP